MQLTHYLLSIFKSTPEALSEAKKALSAAAEKITILKIEYLSARIFSNDKQEQFLEITIDIPYYKGLEHKLHHLIGGKPSIITADLYEGASNSRVEVVGMLLDSSPFKTRTKIALSDNTSKSDCIKTSADLKYITKAIEKNAAKLNKIIKSCKNPSKKLESSVSPVTSKQAVIDRVQTINGLKGAFWAQSGQGGHIGEFSIKCNFKGEYKEARDFGNQLKQLCTGEPDAVTRFFTKVWTNLSTTPDTKWEVTAAPSETEKETYIVKLSITNPNEYDLSRFQEKQLLRNLDEMEKNKDAIKALINAHTKTNETSAPPVTSKEELAHAAGGAIGSDTARVVEKTNQPSK